MRYPPLQPISLKQPEGYIPPWGHPPKGPLALPGQYTATLKKRQLSKVEELSEPQAFTLRLLNNSSEIASDREALLTAQAKAGDLYRRVQGASRSYDELVSRVKHLKQAMVETVDSSEQQAQKVRALNETLVDASLLLNGDRTISSRQEPVPWSVVGRTSFIYGSIVNSQFKVSGNHLSSLAIAESEYQRVAAMMQEVDTGLTALETELEQLKAPWTPGRIPASF